MARTPQEVFDHHVQALGAGDLDEIVVDYSDDAILITPAGPIRGKDGIRAAFTQSLSTWRARQAKPRCSSKTGNSMIIFTTPIRLPAKIGSVPEILEK